MGEAGRYVYQENPARFAQFAVRVMGVSNQFDSPEATALEGIESLEAFYRDIGMPTSITELGISLSEQDIDTLAYKCSFQDTRTIGEFKKLGKEDMRQIYTMAK